MSQIAMMETLVWLLAVATVICGIGWARSRANYDGLEMDAEQWRDTAWSNYHRSLKLREDALALDTPRGRDIAAALNTTLGQQGIFIDLTVRATRKTIREWDAYRDNLDYAAYAS